MALSCPSQRLVSAESQNLCEKIFPAFTHFNGNNGCHGPFATETGDLISNDADDSAIVPAALSSTLNFST